MNRISSETADKIKSILIVYGIPKILRQSIVEEITTEIGKLECGCQWLSHTEIAKRKWIEYQSTLNQPYHHPFTNWLDKEGE